MKMQPPHLGAAVSAAVRALRRVRAGTSGGGDPAPAATPRAPEEPLDLAEERAASRDLLEIDALIRRFYALSSGSRGPDDWRALRDLFHAGARIGTGRPDPSSVTGLDDVSLDAFIASARERTGTRRAERSRTVHVLGDLAVVISAFEAAPPGAKTTSRGVDVLHLRHDAASGWRIQSVIARGEPRAITEKSADPRPLAARHDG